MSGSVIYRSWPPDFRLSLSHPITPGKGTQRLHTLPEEVICEGTALRANWMPRPRRFLTASQSPRGTLICLMLITSLGPKTESLNCQPVLLTGSLSPAFTGTQIRRERLLSCALCSCPASPPCVCCSQYNPPRAPKDSSGHTKSTLNLLN